MGFVKDDNVTCIRERTLYSGIQTLKFWRLLSTRLGGRQWVHGVRFLSIPDYPVFDGFATVEAPQNGKHSKTVRGIPNLIIDDKPLTSWTFHDFLPSKGFRNVAFIIGKSCHEVLVRL